MPLEQAWDTDTRGESPGNRFRLEGARTLRIDVDGVVSIRSSALLAQDGELELVSPRLTLSAGSLWWRGPRRLRRELIQVSGRGTIRLMDGGKRIRLLRLCEETLTLDARDVLAFEPTVRAHMSVLQSLTALVAVPRPRVEMSGVGVLALTTSWEWEECAADSPRAELAPRFRPSVAWSRGLVWRRGRAGQGWRPLAEARF